MKRIHVFEIIEVKKEEYNSPDFRFHDDYFSDEHIVVPTNRFPFGYLFGDFRFFNGVRLEDMDNCLVELKSVLGRAAALREDYFSEIQKRKVI